MHRINTALLAAGLVGSLAACGPVDETAPDAPTVSRSVELTDATGESRVTVVLSAATEAALDEIDLAGLRLAVGTDGFEALAALDGADDEAGPRPGITVEVVDEQLAEGVDTLDIVETRAPAWRAPFMWRYSYSYDDCVDVTRNSFWHKVFVSVWSKDTANAGWSSLVNDRKLVNGETLSRCDDNTYQLKVGVEARNTDHYSLQFWD